MILSIDLGGTKLAAALLDTKALKAIDSGAFDRNGQTSIKAAIKARRELRTPRDKDPRMLRGTLEELLKPFKGQAKRFGIASAGIIDAGRMMAINPENMGGLLGFNLLRELESITGLSGIAINDAQAAAWAEYKLSYKPLNFAFFTVSTGIGAGLVIDGKLQTRLAGHLGHTAIDINGPLCGCGRQGCAEVLASGKALEDRASGSIKALGTKEIFRRYHKDQAAKALIDESARVFAQLLANAKASLDIDLAVLGGGLGLASLAADLGASKAFAKDLAEAKELSYITLVQKQLELLPIVYQLSLKQAVCGSDAGLIGAALLSLNS